MMSREDMLLRRRWYNHNCTMRREGLRPITFADYLAYVAERRRQQIERTLLRQPKGPQRHREREYISGTTEHGVLSAQAAKLDDTNFNTHMLDMMTRQEGAYHYRPYWRSVGEGCWRKRGNS